MRLEQGDFVVQIIIERNERNANVREVIENRDGVVYLADTLYTYDDKGNCIDKAAGWSSYIVPLSISAKMLRQLNS